MKRGNDTSQLRPEEVEALNDADGEEAGTFKRANKDVLSQRKIYRINKPSFEQKDPALSQQNTSKPSVAFSFPLTSVAPPHTAAESFTQKPIEEKPIASTFSFPIPTAPIQLSRMTNEFPSAAPTIISTNDKGLNDELEAYKLKMKKLNQTFLSWIIKQAEDNIATVWTEGMDDYIKYCKEISQTYPKAASFIAGEVSAQQPTSSDVAMTTKASTAPSFSTSFTAPVSLPAATSCIAAASSVSVTSNSSNPFASVSLKGDSNIIAKAPTTTFNLPTSAPTAPLTATTASPFSGFSFNTSSAPSMAAPKVAEKSITATTAATATISATASPFAGFTGFSSLPNSFNTASSTVTAMSATADPFKSLPPATATNGGFFQMNSAQAPTPSFTGFQNPFSNNNSSTLNASSAASTTASTTSFSIPNFGLPAAGTGFSLNFTPSTAIGRNSGGGTAGGEEDEGGGDDEGEPILEPEKILRNEDDTDIQLHEVPCKLFRFKTDTKEWSDMGKGSLRVVKANDVAGRQRIILRNTMGKPLVNAYFYNDMTFELVKGNGIKFAAFVADEDGTKGMRSFYFKVNAMEVDNTLKALKAGVQSCQ